MMTSVKSIAAAGLALLVPTALSAAPINIGEEYLFFFEGVAGAPLEGSGGGGGATGAPDGPWEFTLASGGTFTIVDCCGSGDRFELFNFGSSIGMTSVPGDPGAPFCGTYTDCIADPNFSFRVFALGPGSYSITGQVVESIGIDGTGFFLVEAAAVPAPGALGLLGLGLLGAATARRRR